MDQLDQEQDYESKEVIEIDNNIVFAKEGKLFTNSLYVAKVFDKDHDKVIRDIKNLECSLNFKTANFGESYFVNSQNKSYPMFEMTEKGFSLLAFGFTGSKAIQFKEMYLNKFEEMREQLKQVNEPKKVLSTLELFDFALQSLKEHENRLLNIETKLDIQESNREKLLSEFSTCEYSDRLPLEVPVRKKLQG